MRSGEARVIPTFPSQIASFSPCCFLRITFLEMLEKDSWDFKDNHSRYTGEPNEIEGCFCQIYLIKNLNIYIVRIQVVLTLHRSIIHEDQFSQFS
ncbi:hypothetical protein PRBEI_2000448900 [Prionailurus iriomotensis]